MFFVVGCQKSGTTWVQKLLDGHPAIRCNGEGYFAAILLPVLQQALEVYNQKQKVGPEGRFDENDLYHLFTTAVGLQFRRWVGDAEVACLGEKTPEHAMCLGALDRAFPTSRVIHIIRDGRDVAVSGWFHNLRKAGPGFQQRFPTLARYVEYLLQAHWVPYIQQARAFGKAHPDRYFELRYEDLHARGAELTEQMLTFLEVDASETSVQACCEAGSFNKLAGGRERGREDKQSFFRKGVVGDWREHFDDEAMAVFERLGGPLMRELGYME